MSNLVRPEATASVVPAKTHAATALHVIFKVAGAEYVLPAHEVLQMESYTGATPVPGAPAWVAGIVQVRGRVVPVVDLRARFGLPPAALGPDSRVVIGERGGRAVALLVDSAREVTKLEPGQLKPAPRILDDQARGFVQAVAQVGSRLLVLVDFAKIIGEESLDVAG